MIDWSKITLKELAGFVSEELRKRGIDTILVGGACVTIYSKIVISRMILTISLMMI